MSINSISGYGNVYEVNNIQKEKTTGALTNNTLISNVDSFAPSSDHRQTKPETDEGILKALKKQQQREAMVKTDGSDSDNIKTSEKNNRRTKVIMYMEQGYTYEEALEKTKPQKSRIMTILPINSDDDKDPFFKEENDFIYF